MDVLGIPSCIKQAGHQAGTVYGIPLGHAYTAHQDMVFVHRVNADYVVVPALVVVAENVEVGALADNLRPGVAFVGAAVNAIQRAIGTRHHAIHVSRVLWAHCNRDAVSRGAAGQGHIGIGGTAVC